MLTSMVSNSRDSAAALAMSSGDHSVAEEQTAAARTRRTVDEMAVEDFMVGAVWIDLVSCVWVNNFHHVGRMYLVLQ